MCGRFQFMPDKNPAAAENLAWVKDWAGFSTSYNFAPSQSIPILFADGGLRQEMAFWGFPAPHGQSHAALINARVETAADKNTFQEAWHHRRCLVLATGYYEWLPVKGRSQPGRRPFLLQPKGASLFCMAGLWQPIAGSAGGISCCILTTEAEPTLNWLHPRMPLVLDQSSGMQAWLESASLETYKGEWQWRQVSSYLNKVGNDGPRCVESELLWEPNSDG